jgi:hypothetical protein
MLSPFPRRHPTLALWVGHDQEEPGTLLVPCPRLYFPLRSALRSAPCTSLKYWTL